MPTLDISLYVWSLVLCFFLMQYVNISRAQCTMPLTRGPRIVQRNPYAFIGENLSLSCFVEFDPSLSSNVSNFSLRFHSNLSGKCKEIPLSHFEKNNSYVEIAINHMIDASVVLVGTKFLSYRCTSHSSSCTGRRKLRRCAVRIGETNSLFIPIEYRPLPVYNMSCVVYDWETMTCVWDLGVVYINGEIDTDVTVGYRNSSGIHASSSEISDVNRDRDLKLTIVAPLSPCRKIEMKGSMLTCTFPGNGGSDGYHPGLYYFQINITNNKRLVSAVTNMTINTLHIVRPAKVVDLFVNISSTSAFVTWTRRKPRYKVQCLAKYFSGWRDDSQGITLQDKIVLNDLIPNTEYTFDIACIPVDMDNKTNGYWSEPVQTVAHTSEDVPGSVPDVIPNFFHCLQEECSTARVYFQPIPEILRHGSITEYRITVNKEHYKVSGTMTSAVVPLHKSFSNISITQATSKGYPHVPPSTFVIHPQNIRPPLPSDVIAVAVNTTRVKVSWSSVKLTHEDMHLLSYIVLWCMKGSTASCVGVIQYKSVSPLSDEDFITIKNGNLTSYQFGVASDAMMNHMNSGSGIQWNECTFNHSEVTNVRLTLKIVMMETRTNSMTMRWDPYSCDTTRVYLLNYVLYYCSASRVCTVEDISVVTINRLEQNYTIQNLPPGKYKSWIQGNFSSGNGPNSTDIDFVIYPQSDESVVLWWIILLCVLLVFLAVLLVYFLRRLRKTWKDELPIQVPSVNRGKTEGSQSDQSSGYFSSANSEKPFITARHKISLKEHTENSNMLNMVSKECVEEETEIVYTDNSYTPFIVKDSVMGSTETLEDDKYSAKDIEAALQDDAPGDKGVDTDDINSYSHVNINSSYTHMIDKNGYVSC